MSAATGTLDDLTVDRLAEQAAEAIRVLTHLTRPGLGAPCDPAQAADLIAALAYLSGGLPQLLGQIGRWLAGEQRAGRLRVEGMSAFGEPTAATDAVTGFLAQAAQCATIASQALDTAHQHLAHLGATTPGGLP